MSTAEPHMYVYELPYIETQRLCFLLDKDNKWENLGKRMGFGDVDMETARNELTRGRSPSRELLTMWGHFNHTVTGKFTYEAYNSLVS